MIAVKQLNLLHLPWLLLVVFVLSNKPLIAQSGSDFWLWGDVGVLYTLPDQNTSVNAYYQYVASNNGSDYFIQTGNLLVNHSFLNKHLKATAGYTFGELANVGNVRVPVLRLQYIFTKTKLHYYARLGYDRLSFDTKPEVESISTNNRYRLQLGIAPKLAPSILLIANTEHFIKREEGWWTEHRTIAGFDLKMTDQCHLRTFYFNRWINFEGAPERWNHALIASLRFFISAPSQVHKRSPVDLNGN
ncbi:MAG: DUF2490 domain-containing protein [Bacteroidota bacterium]